MIPDLPVQPAVPDLVEELVEELSLLEDEGRERARNLTTDLLLYLQ